MVSRKRGLVTVGLILVLLGGYSLYTSNPVHSYQSTFNLLPLKYLKIVANLRDQTRITGAFQETSGRSVEFRIMSSVQFAAFQTRTGNASLYALPETATGQVDFTSTVPDTYYLLFLHGSAFPNTTQTVNFQRTYTSIDVPAILSGIALIVIAGVEIYWGFRPSGRQHTSSAATPGDVPRPPWP